METVTLNGLFNVFVSFMIATASAEIVIEGFLRKRLMNSLFNILAALRNLVLLYLAIVIIVRYGEKIRGAIALFN